MTQQLTPESALREAVDQIGSQARMARLCGVAQPSVFKWLTRGKVLPAEFVLKVEAATGVSRHDLRPDIYPIEDPRTSPPHGGTPTPEGPSELQPQPSGVDPIESARA